MTGRRPSRPRAEPARERAAFRELPGFGAATERRLHEAGVHTWAALADVVGVLRGVRGGTGDRLAELADRIAGRRAAGRPAATGPLPANGERTGSRAPVAPAPGSTGSTRSAGSTRRARTIPASREHVVVLDAGKVLGGEGRTVELVVRSTGARRVGPFAYQAMLSARAYGDAAPGERGWTTLGVRTGQGEGSLPLRFETVILPAGLHRLRLRLAVRLPDARPTAPAFTVGGPSPRSAPVSATAPAAPARRP